MPGRFISSIALALFATILVASPARAEMIDIPACRRDLAAANHLIEAIQAREPMNRCLTGHEHGETVAQMDDSIADIRLAIANHCAK
jgi:hypothetical protein